MTDAPTLTQRAEEITSKARTYSLDDGYVDFDYSDQECVSFASTALAAAYAEGERMGLERACEFLETHSVVHGCPGSTTIQPCDDSSIEHERFLWSKEIRSLKPTGAE